MEGSEISETGRERGAVVEAVQRDVQDSFASGLERDVAPTPSDSELASFLDFDALPADPQVDGYWVDDPFVYVSIHFHEDDNTPHYHFLEPAVSSFESQVYEDIEPTIRQSLLRERFERTDEGIEAFERELVDLLDTHASELDPVNRWTLYYYFRRNFVGFDQLDPLLQDEHIEDISCDGGGVPVYVYHRDFGDIPSQLTFDEETAKSLTIQLAQRAGRHVSASYPLATTTLPDGSRIQVTLESDVPIRGSNFTIRKFREEPFTPVDLVDLDSFSIEQLAYLWLAVEYNRSILFVGPTASGKTTSMNAVSLFIPPDEKVISLEETHEVHLPHENWIANVTREEGMEEHRPEIEMYDLLDEALHQRPDHLLVGELRTDPDVVYTFFQAIGTGHEGFSTFHAESSEDTIHRLSHSPLNIPYELIGDLDVVVVQQIMAEEGPDVRRCRQLTEVYSPYEQEETRPDLRDVFQYDTDSQTFEQTADSRLLAEIADEEGWDADRLRDELAKRRTVLGYLVANDITEFEHVTRELFDFNREPSDLFDRIGDREPAGSALSFSNDPLEE